MRLGIHLVSYGLPGGPAALPRALAELGRACEEARVDVLSLMDHHFQLAFLGEANEPMLEGYTTLGFVAAHTSTVQLQLLVTGVTYRHPGVLAKQVATLDVLSGGRAALGIGAAWYEKEHLGLGVPFPPLAERFERLEEAVQVVRQMWSDDDGPFHGRHYDLAETICSPKPSSPVPVMVGGGGERKTLRLVAKYGDACNVFAGRGSGPDEVAHKLAVLRDWCQREGRPYDDIRRTILWNGHLEPDASGGAAFVEQMRAFADLGVHEVHVMPLPPDSSRDPVGFVRALGEHVVPRLRQL